jgi:hypothetical protein
VSITPQRLTVRLAWAGRVLDHLTHMKCAHSCALAGTRNNEVAVTITPTRLTVRLACLYRGIALHTFDVCAIFVLILHSRHPQG